LIDKKEDWVVGGEIENKKHVNLSHEIRIIPQKSKIKIQIPIKKDLKKMNKVNSG
jgi:hypothetical protein